MALTFSVSTLGLTRMRRLMTIIVNCNAAETEMYPQNGIENSIICVIFKYTYIQFVGCKMSVYI